MHCILSSLDTKTNFLENSHFAHEETCAALYSDPWQKECNSRSHRKRVVRVSEKHLIFAGIYQEPFQTLVSTTLQGGNSKSIFLVKRSYWYSGILEVLPTSPCIRSWYSCDRMHWCLKCWLQIKQVIWHPWGAGETQAEEFFLTLKSQNLKHWISGSATQHGLMGCMWTLSKMISMQERFAIRTCLWSWELRRGL